MKTKLFFSLVLFSCFNIVMSQAPLNMDDFEVKGESQYVVAYEMAYLKDTTQPDKISYDEIILEISGGLSKSYSYKLSCDSRCK